MSNSKKLFIAFCEENQNIAEEISQKLKRVGFKFELLSSSKIKENSNLVNLIMDQKNPGLLLISDNYLKSEICMERMLEFINNSNNSNNITPIIIDGRYPNEAGTGFETVETSFDRVSNVIKYMNYWQDRYLDLRREKRSIAPSETADFEIILDRVKSISAGVGDFLRILRTKTHYSFADFEKNDFETFFKMYGDDNSYKTYQSLAAKDPKKESKTPPQSTINDPIQEAADKKIVLPVLEEKVAEVDVNTVENISTKVAEADLASVIEETTSETVLDSGTKMQMSTNPGVESEEESEISATFEQQVEEIVEEIENEEMLSESEKQDHSNPDNELEYSTEPFSDAIFEEEEEEDITSDFDPATDSVFEPILVEKKIEDNSLNNIDQMIFDASTLIESGEIDDAISKLKDVLKQQPENNGARYMYAMILFNYQEDYDRAYAQLQKVVEFDPQNAEAFEHLGKISEINNDFLKAKKYYEKVAELKPHTYGIYYKLGLITSGFFSDKKKKAYKYYEKAIKQDKHNVDAHYRIGLLLNEAFHQPKKAANHFKKVLKLDPNHQFVNYDLALLYNELGDLRKASKFYKRAFQINPEIKTPENDIVFSLDKKTPSGPEESFSVDINNQNEKTESPSEHIENELITNPNSDKVVFITGATSGIGKATAELFASNGYRLILNGRRKDRLKNLQKEFNNFYQTDSKILPFDVRNIDNVKKAIEDLGKEWSKVDILINNAGLAKGYAPIHEGNLDHWETMIDTNIKGLLYLTRAIAPHMVKRQSGHIINVCSSAGHEVYPNGNVYCATKFAVDALTKSMRIDLHKHKIRVGQVSPGHVEETEFAFVRFDDKEKAKIYEDFQPLKSKDVAEVIYFMVTAPAHVNIQDVQMMGTQQASNVFIDRSGK